MNSIQFLIMVSVWLYILFYAYINAPIRFLLPARRMVSVQLLLRMILFIEFGNSRSILALAGRRRGFRIARHGIAEEGAVEVVRIHELAVIGVGVLMKKAGGFR